MSAAPAVPGRKAAGRRRLLAHAAGLGSLAGLTQPLVIFGATGLASALSSLGGCGLAGSLHVPPSSREPESRDASTPAELQALAASAPAAPREFRAAWVASVAHIDWPSRPELGTEAQRAELHRICQRAAAIGLNALIVQIRPAADALYESALEPWSEYLTGTQGRAPHPAWDPLQEWCDQAHRNGLELHAWFNPYRARHPTARSIEHAQHVARRLPHAVRRYGELLWLDPAEPSAQAHTLAVVADVLRRYPVDAVHVDDYFYPYPVSAPGGGGAELPFPDDELYTRFRAGGGILGRDDWRRAQVDDLVRRLFDTVRETAPGVRLGISPFGLMRPDLRPAGIAGFSQYDKLFADVERWLAEGWLDYLVPQLYWPRAQAAQAFVPLLDRWLALNLQGRHLWPGLFTSRIGDAQRPWMAGEVVGQIAAARERTAAAMGADLRPAPVGGTGAAPPSQGHVHFSMVALLQDRDGIATRLQREAYAQAALAPATPWVAAPPAPPAPQIALLRDASEPRMRLTLPDGRAPLRWALWHRHDGRWQFSTAPGGATQVGLDPDPLGAPADAVVASAVDRFGQEGPRTAMALTAGRSA